MKKPIRVGVCKGRHEMPCNLFVFDNTIADPTNVKEIEEEAVNFFKANFSDKPCNTIEIYVTGLTVAVIAAIKVATKYFCNVIAMHYDMKKDCYYMQSIK